MGKEAHLISQPAAKAPAKHARVADGDDDAGPPALTLAEVKAQWQSGKVWCSVVLSLI